MDDEAILKLCYDSYRAELAIKEAMIRRCSFVFTMLVFGCGVLTAVPADSSSALITVSDSVVNVCSWAAMLLLACATAFWACALWPREHELVQPLREYLIQSRKYEAELRKSGHEQNGECWTPPEVLVENLTIRLTDAEASVAKSNRSRERAFAWTLFFVIFAMIAIVVRSFIA